MTPFAAVQARLGEATVRRLANAMLSIVGEEPVAGILAREPRAADLGETAMMAERSRFTCLAADLSAIDDLVREDDYIEIADQRWRVALRTDDALLGQVVLDLVRAP